MYNDTNHPLVSAGLSAATTAQLMLLILFILLISIYQLAKNVNYYFSNST